MPRRARASRMRSPSRPRYSASEDAASPTRASDAIARPSLAAACARAYMYYIACVDANMHYSRGRFRGGRVAESVTILVGTMTGTADLVAQDVADALAAQGIAAEVVQMDGLDAGVFTRNGAFLICSSTYGQGDV